MGDTPQQPLSATKRTVFATGALLVLATVGIVAVRFVQQHTLIGTNTTTNNTNSTGTATVEQGGITVPGEPSVIHARTGKIISVRGNQFRLSAQVFNGAQQKYENIEMVATIVPTTTFLEVDRSVPLSPPIPGKQLATSNMRAIDSTAFSNGDTVQIFSADNIQGVRQFTASTVWRLINLP